MEKWAFGLTMMLVGLGGTFATLGVLILLTMLFKRLFPVSGESNPQKK